MTSAGTDELPFEESVSDGTTSPGFDEGHTVSRKTRIDLFGDLIEVIRPPDFYVRSKDGQIWIDEATCRAKRFLGLFLQLETKMWNASASERQIRSERRIAKNLVNSFERLNRIQGGPIQTCGPVLQKLLGELTTFKLAAAVSIKIDVVPYTAQVEQNRALVLLVIELVLYLLQEGLPHQYVGQIRLTLKQDQGLGATLIVSAGGGGFERFCHQESWSIVTGLTKLLNGEMLVRSECGAATSIEINFSHGVLRNEP